MTERTRGLRPNYQLLGTTGDHVVVQSSFYNRDTMKPSQPALNIMDSDEDVPKVELPPGDDLGDDKPETFQEKSIDAPPIEQELLEQQNYQQFLQQQQQQFLQEQLLQKEEEQRLLLLQQEDERQHFLLQQERERDIRMQHAPHAGLQNTAYASHGVTELTGQQTPPQGRGHLS